MNLTTIIIIIVSIIIGGYLGELTGRYLKKRKDKNKNNGNHNSNISKV